MSIYLDLRNVILVFSRFVSIERDAATTLQCNDVMATNLDSYKGTKVSCVRCTSPIKQLKINFKGNINERLQCLYTKVEIISQNN